MGFDLKAILFASGNKGKLAEVREIASTIGLEVFSPEELRNLKNLPPVPEVEESAETYHENAKLKADSLYVWSKGFPTLSDDSGLEVAALGGAPGVSTARYAGIGASNDQNITKLLEAMKGQTDRSARFVCHLCFRRGDDKYETTEAYMQGAVGTNKYGNGGFGYDPILIPHGYAETLAELKEKHIEVPTHRILALRKLFKI